MKNLTQLRKNQRIDKTKSGRKQPRKFDLVQIHELNNRENSEENHNSQSRSRQTRKFDLIQINELYNEEQSEEIQLNLALSYPLLPPSTVDDVINAVIAQTDDQPEPAK